MLARYHAWSTRHMEIWKKLAIKTIEDVFAGEIKMGPESLAKLPEEMKKEPWIDLLTDEQINKVHGIALTFQSDLKRYCKHNFRNAC